MTLKGKNVLITSGPTRMPLDAVRYISNHSTGKFGTLLAREVLRNGGRVLFVHGVGSLIPAKHPRLKCISVTTNEDVAGVLKNRLEERRVDCVIHAMAVLDFQASRLKKNKTATRNGIWNLKLIPTPKIINRIKKWSPRTFLVGFKLEVGLSKKELLRRGIRLIKESGADLVLANLLTAGEDARHGGYLLDRQGSLVAQARGKENLAKLIVRHIGARLYYAEHRMVYNGSALHNGEQTK